VSDLDAQRIAIVRAHMEAENRHFSDANRSDSII
jgi:hypothetical protein